MNRRGCGCSTTCTWLREFEAKSSDVQHEACCRARYEGSTSRIRMGEFQLSRISPYGPSSKAGLPSGGRTVSACNALSSSTQQRFTGQSRVREVSDTAPPKEAKEIVRRYFCPVTLKTA